MAAAQQKLEAAAESCPQLPTPGGGPLVALRDERATTRRFRLPGVSVELVLKNKVKLGLIIRYLQANVHKSECIIFPFCSHYQLLTVERNAMERSE